MYTKSGFCYNHWDFGPNCKRRLNYLQKKTVVEYKTHHTHTVATLPAAMKQLLLMPQQMQHLQVVVH
jgi:hypothetical protein